ncbi:hypothetical protein J4050_08465 [Winogradskyella sp. DF17]|jgi:hypothetical protein|uniref:Uncharacterized protein n=1 Tax=Winogradskyella pelagia TaxID=2819984 RepID=A0ABS3T219_9FLAO|nr:hypothetical protein [Winogradskyella sp. DF17]MBO3116777.1 hypothetical protein [Winogradskyella sp. DF17]
MSNDYNNPAFKKWLQRLQEESWQLELLISGFAIFGLFSAITPLEVLLKEAQTDENSLAILPITVTLISCVILLFNLLLHVVLRGLWIGALGLRYVSGDIDYDYLNYSPKFSNYLRKKVGSFDRYISRLENYCSVIFAISFLLIFYVLAFIFTIASIGIIIKLLLSNDDLGSWGRLIGIPLIVFFSVGMLMVFIDFATQGWLKKKKWISKIYFPFYWVFSYITLSFLYRPLVYNFLDNKFGKRLSLLLLPIYILLFVLTSYTNKTSNYFNRNLYSSDIIGISSNYEDMLDDEKDFIEDVVIPSKVITDDFLKMFMLINEDIENNVFAFNPKLQPEKDIRGFSSDIVFLNDLSRKDRDSIRHAYMKTLNNVYKVRIDSTEYDCEFILTETKKKQKGFETYLNLKEVAPGKHLFSLTRREIIKKDTSTFFVKQIPFWYFPNK